MTNYCWYFHDQDAGAYHVIERHATGASRCYRVRFNLDPATGDGRTYAFRPTKAQCLAVLHHLAPEAVELPGLPAWLR